MLDSPDWSASGRGVAENYSTGSVHQELYSVVSVATHSSTLAWRIPWMEEPGGLQSMGLLESDTTE